MKTYWYKGEWGEEVGNVGDMLTPYIMEYLTGDRPTESCDCREKNKFLSVGSIIEYIEDGDTVFGSGLIRPKRLKKKNDVTFLCVRGRETAKELRRIGYDVPEAYGTPTIFMADIYHPKVEKKCKVAYIPHYVEKAEYLDEYPDGYYIDIINRPLDFIDELLACESIVTSSLHAFILAEVYGIEAQYVQLTNKIIGGYYKYHDYLTGDNNKEMMRAVFEQWYREYLKKQ